MGNADGANQFFGQAAYESSLQKNPLVSHPDLVESQLNTINNTGCIETNLTSL